MELLKLKWKYIKSEPGSAYNTNEVGLVCTQKDNIILINSYMSKVIAQHIVKIHNNSLRKK